jgi:hypothetical protein
MTTFVRAATLAVLLAGLAAGPAPGNGWRRQASYYSGYYVPVAVGTTYYQAVPVYVVQPAVVCVPGTAVELPLAVSPYAVPKPAPPSPMQTTDEPPLAKPGVKRAPAVSESRSSGWQAADLQPDAGTAVKELLPVGFWNVSNRDVVLTVAGRARVLPANHSITLQVEREFSWQLDQQPAQQGRVPAGKSSLQLVIR